MVIYTKALNATRLRKLLNVLNSALLIWIYFCENYKYILNEILNNKFDSVRFLDA